MVPAVERALAVLGALAAATEPLSLAALTARVGVPKSSVLAICATLVRGGLLHRSRSGSYSLGVGVVDLARAYLAHSDATTVFGTVWETREPQLEDTVVLSVLDAREVVYVACRNGTRGLSFSYRMGMRLPAHCTASGKAMLSTLPAGAVEALFSGATFAPLTASSIADSAALRRDLQATRERGYARDEEETREGMCCVGAPVFDASGGPAVAAVAISLLKAEYASPRRDDAIATVRRFAAEMSRRLGARETPPKTGASPHPGAAGTGPP